MSFTKKDGSSELSKEQVGNHGCLMLVIISLLHYPCIMCKIQLLNKKNDIARALVLVGATCERWTLVIMVTNVQTD